MGRPPTLVPDAAHRLLLEGSHDTAGHCGCSLASTCVTLEQECDSVRDGCKRVGTRVPLSRRQLRSFEAVRGGSREGRGWPRQSVPGAGARVPRGRYSQCHGSEGTVRRKPWRHALASSQR